MEKVYFNINELCERFQRERTTLYRWMNRETNPFPKPRIGGSKNLWAVKDVEAWEASLQEIA